MKKSRPKTEWETAVPFATEICMSMYELYICICICIYTYTYIWMYVHVCMSLTEFYAFNVNI